MQGKQALNRLLTVFRRRVPRILDFGWLDQQSGFPQSVLHVCGNLVKVSLSQQWTSYHNRIESERLYSAHGQPYRLSQQAFCSISIYGFPKLGASRKGEPTRQFATFLQNLEYQQLVHNGLAVSKYTFEIPVAGKPVFSW
jgi:hypothetical protein